jgi:hypothetical protein
MIPEETNTTFDNDYLTAKGLYEFYNYKIWNNRFAKVMSIEEIEKRGEPEPWGCCKRIIQILILWCKNLNICERASVGNKLS